MRKRFIILRVENGPRNRASMVVTGMDAPRFPRVIASPPRRTKHS